MSDTEKEVMAMYRESAPDENKLFWRSHVNHVAWSLLLIVIAFSVWLMIALAICLALAANLWLRSFVRSTLLEVHSQRLETAGEHVSAELDTAMLLRLQSVSVVASILSQDVQGDD
eukprot:gene12704-15523_t